MRHVCEAMRRSLALLKKLNPNDPKDKIWVCKCDKKRKQPKGHGYANLFRHIQDKHENFEEMLAHNTRLEVLQISKKASNIYS